MLYSTRFLGTVTVLLLNIVVDCSTEEDVWVINALPEKYFWFLVSSENFDPTPGSFVAASGSVNEKNIGLLSLLSPASI